MATWITFRRNKRVATDRVQRPQKRLNKEIRRRADVVGSFHGRGAIGRLIRSILAEQSDEWAKQRRHMGPEILGHYRLHLIKGKPTETTEPTARLTSTADHRVTVDTPRHRT
ncbi:transposase [Streptomyces sp. NBC_01717]|uniref:transposase n=1 Tax=Streptomyces sp. NBC_01717 TaxID=2975918 RepID=UPI003FCEB429